MIKRIQSSVRLGCNKQSKRKRSGILRRRLGARSGRNFISDDIDHAYVRIAVGQIRESLLCEVETNAGSVDGGELNRHARRGVSDVPARAAIRRVPHDVESAADEWEGRKAAERREVRVETVVPIGACNGVHRAIRVVERGVPRGFQGRGRRHTGL